MLDDLKLRLGGLVARIRSETWKCVGMGIDDHEGLVSNLPWAVRGTWLSRKAQCDYEEEEVQNSDYISYRKSVVNRL